MQYDEIKIMRWRQFFKKLLVAYNSSKQEERCELKSYGEGQEEEDEQK